MQYSIQHQIKVAEALKNAKRVEAIDLPLTTEFSTTSLPAAVVLSHPGWSRLYYKAQYNKKMRKWCSAQLARVNARRDVSSDPSEPDHYRELILPKLWFAENKFYTALLLEVMSEHAFAVCQRRRVPVILTIPSRFKACGKQVIPVGTSGQIIKYLRRFLHSRNTNVFALPTMLRSGRLIESPSIDSSDEFSEEAKPVWDALLGPVINSGVKKLQFCGGFFSQCMRHTLALVLGKINVAVLDKLSVSSPPNRFSDHVHELPDEAGKKVAKLLRGTRTAAELINTNAEIVRIFRENLKLVNRWDDMHALELEAASRQDPPFDPDLFAIANDDLPED